MDFAIEYLNFDNGIDSCSIRVPLACRGAGDPEINSGGVPMSSASYQSTVGALFSIFSSNLGPPSLDDHYSRDPYRNHLFLPLTRQENFTLQYRDQIIPHLIPEKNSSLEFRKNHLFRKI